MRAYEAGARDDFREKYNEVMSKYHHGRHKGKAVGCRACVAYEKEAEELVRENTREYATRSKEWKDWTVMSRLCLMAGATYAPTKYDMLDVPDTDVPDSLHASFFIPEVWSNDDPKHPLVDAEDWWSKFLTEPPEEVEGVPLGEEEDAMEEPSDEPDEEEPMDEEHEEFTVRREVLLAPEEGTEVDEQGTAVNTAAFLEVFGMKVEPDDLTDAFNEVSTFYVNRRYVGSLDIGLRVPLLYSFPVQGEALDVCLDAECLAQTVLTPSEWDMVLHADPDKLPDTIKRRLGNAWLDVWHTVSLEPKEGAERGYVFVTKGKTKAARRYVPLTMRAHGILAERSAKRGFSNYVWTLKHGRQLNRMYASKLFHALAKAEGLPWDAVVHSTRHTFCTRLGESGADAFTIKQLAGHASITVSSRYVHPTPARLEAAIGMLESVRVSTNSVENGA